MFHDQIKHFKAVFVLLALLEFCYRNLRENKELFAENYQKPNREITNKGAFINHVDNQEGRRVLKNLQNFV